MDKITIGGKEYFIARPVFVILDAVKEQTGIDFALGVDEARSRQAMGDMKKLPKLIAYLTCDKEDENFDEGKAKIREEFFYRNAEMVDFARVMGFFCKQLKESEEDSSGKTSPGKSSMKLVKKK